MNWSSAAFAAPADIIVAPGELGFAGDGMRLRTLLGSCVALTLWHPERHVGAMCHFLLPCRDRSRDTRPDARYACDAINMLAAGAAARGTALADYEIKMFGGGSMLPATKGSRASDIGARNIAAANDLLAARGLKATVSQVGGRGHRVVVLDTATGHVWMRHAGVPPGDGTRQMR